jgi:hypothetical protein
MQVAEIRNIASLWNFISLYQIQGVDARWRRENAIDCTVAPKSGAKSKICKLEFRCEYERGQEVRRLPNAEVLEGSFQPKNRFSDLTVGR